MAALQGRAARLSVPACPGLYRSCAIHCALTVHPSWSEDSKQLFCYSPSDGMLYAISIERRGEPVPIAQCSGDAPMISPDGKHIAYSDNDRRGRILELSKNSVITSLGRPPTFGRDTMNWSPDGRELSIGGMGLWIYDLETKRASMVLDGFSFGWASWSRDGSRQFALERAFGGRGEIWVASLDPEMTTMESLGAGLTFEEHCREMIDFLTTRIGADHEDAANYLIRGSYYICIQEYEKAAADLERYAEELKSNNIQSVNALWLNSIRDGLASWGIEKYDSGEYEQSLATLTLLDRFRIALDESTPSEVATIAMSLRRLGRDEESQSPRIAHLNTLALALSVRQDTQNHLISSNRPRRTDALSLEAHVLLLFKPQIY